MNTPLKLRLGLVAIAALSLGPMPACAADTDAVTQHDVLPILLRHCTACHGPRRQEGGLDLRSRASMMRGGKSGPALIPGKPEASRLVQKVRGGAMPPPPRLVEASVKPVDPADLERIVQWIARGAPEGRVEPDVATTSPDPLVTDRDRDFWSFRPPQPVSPRALASAAQPVSPRALASAAQRPASAAHRARQGSRRNRIDEFILDKLDAQRQTLAPEPDRLTLLRRASFDLLGLPPTPEEAEAFLNDPAPDAYDRLIERLLASPHYGERWGRYWLDLAGYADSEGKREQDLPRPHAWRYRDYVIRAFNSDKPYDRFLLEQLAGDELADWHGAKEITPEIYDNLVATGFLRMAPDATWANITGYAPDRLEVIADEIDVLGSAVMGLSLKCARCHDHKFDPIPQRDYYRLLDIFKGALDEYDWLKPDVRPGLGPVSQDVTAGRHLPHVTTAERRAWEANGKRGPEPRIQALWDRGEPSPTYIAKRGDPLRPGKLVGPGVPSVLTDGRTPFDVKPPWPGAKSTGRRLAFAKWLTRPDHPLTARVMVNRLWKLHFGTGLVPTLADFGKAGSPPTHPELLDWLALEFTHRGWSLKAMHRIMMTSSFYRMRSAECGVRNEELRTLHSALRTGMRRLDAEALYDALLRVAGRLDETMSGPADVVKAQPDGLVTPEPTARGWRRLVYVRQLRKQMPTHLETFDFPAMNPNCVERRDSTVAPQALHLMNSAMVRQLAENFAQRVRREAGADPARQIERAYLIALGRSPTAEEQRMGIEALNTLAEAWGGPTAAAKALASYCHTLLNSAAFSYVD